MEKNYLIVHGSFGTPFINWFKWLNDELVKRDECVIVPQFPIGVDYQNYSNWSKLLKYYCDLGLINKNTVLVGHSLSPIFIVKFLIENKTEVSKLVFVSGFNNYFMGADGKDYDTVNKTFYINNAEEVHDYCKDITCVYSDNDPYVPLNILEEFADSVANKKILIENGGHLNGEAGYNEFEKLLELI